MIHLRSAPSPTVWRRRKRTLACILISLAAIHLALFARTSLQLLLLDHDNQSLLFLGAILCWAFVASAVLINQAWLYAIIAVRLDSREGCVVVERLLLRSLSFPNNTAVSRVVRIIGDGESSGVENAVLHTTASGSFVSTSGFTHADGELKAYLPATD
jgi:ABC-type bacteriocin/lantibiotic exporter with double-glycine peptidase domain